MSHRNSTIKHTRVPVKPPLLHWSRSLKERHFSCFAVWWNSPSLLKTFLNKMWNNICSSFSRAVPLPPASINMEMYSLLYPVCICLTHFPFVYISVNNCGACDSIRCWERDSSPWSIHHCWSQRHHFLPAQFFCSAKPSIFSQFYASSSEKFVNFFWQRFFFKKENKQNLTKVCFCRCDFMKYSKLLWRKCSLPFNPEQNHMLMLLHVNTHLNGGNHINK